MSDNEQLYVPFLEEGDDDEGFIQPTLIFAGQPHPFGANPLHTLAGVRWRITTQSIVADWGCLAHDKQVVDLRNIRELRYTSCCFGCVPSSIGTIEVFTGSLAEPTMTISGLPQARRIFRAVHDALRTLQSATTGRAIAVAPMAEDTPSSSAAASSSTSSPEALTLGSKTKKPVKRGLVPDDLLDDDDDDDD